MYGYFRSNTFVTKMAITYKLNDQRASFHWDKHNDLWTAKSDDLAGLNLEAKSFETMISMLNQQCPELTDSVRIFFPDAIKAFA
jgi:hypothetical protein